MHSNNGGEMLYEPSCNSTGGCEVCVGNDRLLVCNTRSGNGVPGVHLVEGEGGE